MHFTWLQRSAFAATIVCSTWATAQDSLPAAPALPAERDPTQPSGDLRKLLARPETAPGAAAALPPSPLPLLSVRAKILGPRRGDAIALLALGENRMITVRAGKTYAIDERSEQTLTVIAIAREGIEVELAPSGRKLTLP